MINENIYTNPHDPNFDFEKYLSIKNNQLKKIGSYIRLDSPDDITLDGMFSVKQLIEILAIMNEVKDMEIINLRLKGIE